MTEILINQASRHNVFVQRFAGHLASLFDPYANELIASVKSIMSEAPETLQNQKKISSLIGKIREANAITFKNYNDDVLYSQLREFAINESKWELESLESVIKSQSVSLTLPSRKQIWTGVLSSPLIFEQSNTVKLLEPFIRDWETQQIKKVSDQIRVGYITGQTTDEISRNIAKKNGIIDKNLRRSIKSMVRTSTNHISNVSRSETMNDNDDIVRGYQWISTLDNRTTTTCASRDRQIFLVNAKFKPQPPAHINCRSSTIPLLDERFAIDNSDATRASKGAEGGQQVDANKSYYSWLKGQPKSFQDETLGRSRGALLRNGGLTADEFRKLSVDKLFRPMTLTEMKAKNPLAFEKAGL